jgi:hypothetical protein
MENNTKSIREIDLRTKGYSFTIEVFEDTDFDDFLATINGFTPPLAQEIPPGGKVTFMRPIQQQEFRDKDQERLLKDCRAWITKLDGEILIDIEQRQ